MKKFLSGVICAGLFLVAFSSTGMEVDMERRVEWKRHAREILQKMKDDKALLRTIDDLSLLKKTYEQAVEDMEEEIRLNDLPVSDAMLSGLKAQLESAYLKSLWRIKKEEFPNTEIYFVSPDLDFVLLLMEDHGYSIEKLGKMYDYNIKLIKQKVQDQEERESLLREMVDVYIKEEKRIFDLISEDLKRKMRAYREAVNSATVADEWRTEQEWERVTKHYLSIKSSLDSLYSSRIKKTRHYVKKEMGEIQGRHDLFVSDFIKKTKAFYKKSIQKAFLAKGEKEKKKTWQWAHQLYKYALFFLSFSRGDVAQEIKDLHEDFTNATLRLAKSSRENFEKYCGFAFGAQEENLAKDFWKIMNLHYNFAIGYYNNLAQRPLPELTQEKAKEIRGTMTKMRNELRKKFVQEYSEDFFRD